MKYCVQEIGFVSFHYRRVAMRSESLKCKENELPHA